MILYRRLTALVLSINLLIPCGAQRMPILVRKPDGRPPVRSYRSTTLPPVRLENSPRLYKLIRVGKLYLTVADAIALAIENNLDLEISRYGPLIAEWNRARAEAGGPLRGVASGNSQIGQVASGQGISGSQSSAGLGGGSGNGGNGGTGGAAVSQIGPVTANLDPVLQNTTLFSHTTFPQVNTRQSRTSALVDISRIYNTSLQQGLLSGGFAQISFRESYLRENSPTNILNPSVAPRLYLYLQHNLLQGFGREVNYRFIKVANRNVQGSSHAFRSQLIDLVSIVLNQYWGLVVDMESRKGKQRALDVATKFFNDTRKQIDIGVLSKVDIYRAEAETGTRRRELGEAEAAVRLRGNTLKSMLSLNGMADPLLDSVEVIPVDSLLIPERDNLPPLRELLATALSKRPDVAAAEIRLENAETSAVGTASGVLPQLVGITQIYNSGLAGEAQEFRGVGPNPYFVGGLGTALGQVFRRNFHNERAAIFLQGTLNNRIDQGDYGIEQLQLRQSQLMAHRDRNRIVVDISNQVVALRQSRARHAAAVDTHALQQELLQKQQRMYSLGTAAINDVINAQRDLVTAETSEVTALGAYARARIGLDQILGETLEKNNVLLEEALAGAASK
ncbi:MAG TPA: TolC family protein [Bryobacteraceae bacterium]|nr:TolC family protein [Bryobacteraceae bacterium]